MKLSNKFRQIIFTWVLSTVIITNSVLIAGAQQPDAADANRVFLPLITRTDASAVETTVSGEVEASAAQPTASGTDQIIVRYRKAAQLATITTAEQAAQLSQAAGVTLKFQREMSDNAIVLKLPKRLSEKEVQEIANRIALLPEVELAKADIIFKHQLTPNDTRYGEQWHYFAPVAGNYGANLPPAWDITTGAASVVVAVLDTGIRPHVDLAGRTVAGYDFIADVPTANDGNGRDADPSDPGDRCGGGSSSWHGTHVAGTIGAKSNNALGVAGINWVSKIQPVRVLGVCGGFFSDIIDAIRWSAGLSVPGVPANATPADVMNMSLGGGGSCDPLLQSAINDAVGAGTVVVVAGGNSNSDAASFQPASCNGVITVASTGRTGNRAPYSNFGSTIEISAPGGDTSSATANGVLSTLNTGTTVPAADSYAFYQGTSMATPHVAGIVSLMFSVKPTLTPAEVLSILQATVTAFPAGSTCTTALCGPGIVNAAAAVLLAQNGFISPTNLRATTISSAQINLAWNDNSTDETGFKIERCTGATCTSFAQIATVGANVTTYANTGLAAGTSYRYRVRATKTGADSAYSNIAGAATLATGCSLYNSTNVPKSILDNTTVESTLVVTGSGPLNDVNLANLRINHTFDADLVARAG